MFNELEKSLLRQTTLLRKEIVTVFVVLEILLTAIIAIGFLGYFVFPVQLNDVIIFLSSEYMAHHFGEYASYAFCLTLLPSIMQRINIRFPFSLYIQSVLILVRRHMGILMYMLALAHGLMMSIFPRLASDTLLRMPIEEILGLGALLLTTPLFVTANDYSVKLLGKKWKKLHRLSYLIVWIIFLHVAMMLDNRTAFIVAVIGALEILSWTIFWQRQANGKTVIPSATTQPPETQNTPPV
jgi:methionine sulfoxide reductase heme-binding subunit